MNNYNKELKRIREHFSKLKQTTANIARRSYEINKLRRDYGKEYKQETAGIKRAAYAIQRKLQEQNQDEIKRIYSWKQHKRDSSGKVISTKITQGRFMNTSSQDKSLENKYMIRNYQALKGFNTRMKKRAYFKYYQDYVEGLINKRSLPKNTSDLLEAELESPLKTEAVNRIKGEQDILDFYLNKKLDEEYPQPASQIGEDEDEWMIYNNEISAWNETQEAIDKLNTSSFTPDDWEETWNGLGMVNKKTGEIIYVDDSLFMLLKAMKEVK